MPGESNIDEIGEAIMRLVDAIDFTLPGIDSSMGQDAVHAIAEDIASSAAEIQATPTGVEFPENEEKYAEDKAEKYGMHAPAYGLRTGQTFSLESLLGEVQVGADEVSMTYGTGRPPERSSVTGYITEADKAVTDREKMEWLMDRSNITPYEIGPYAVDAVQEIMEEGLRKHLGGA